MPVIYCNCSTQGPFPKDRTTSACQIGDFNPLLPVFITGLIGLIFLQKVPFLPFSFCCILCFSQWDLRQDNFFPVSVGHIPVFFSSSVLFTENLMIFAERGVDLVSLVPCFKIESCELRLTAFRFQPVESIGVAEVGGSGS